MKASQNKLKKRFTEEKRHTKFMMKYTKIGKNQKN